MKDKFLPCAIVSSTLFVWLAIQNYQMKTQHHAVVKNREAIIDTAISLEKKMANKVDLCVIILNKKLDQDSLSHAIIDALQAGDKKKAAAMAEEYNRINVTIQPLIDSFNHKMK